MQEQQQETLKRANETIAKNVEAIVEMFKQFDAEFGEAIPCGHMQSYMAQEIAFTAAAWGGSNGYEMIGILTEAMHDIREEMND